MIFRENNVNSIVNSRINKDIYLENEEKIFETIDLDKDIVIPSFMSDWLLQNINKNAKGIFLIRSESGTGKTIFTKLLDKEYYGKISINNCIIKSYYINSYFSYKESVFRNNFVDILKKDSQTNQYLRGDLPSFSNITELTDKERLANILNEYRIIYKEKYNVSKLLFIFDGIDEIKHINGNSILDYIPSEEMLHDDVYILLTSRNQAQTPPLVNDFINSTSFKDILDVSTNNQDYLDLLKRHIKSKLELTDDSLVLFILQYIRSKFSAFKILYQIIKNGDVSLTRDLSEEEIILKFLDKLEIQYSGKYYKNIRNILLILSISRTALSIDELKYLLNQDELDFKFLSYLSDINCVLTKERTYRGNEIALSHNSIRNVISNHYQKDEDVFIKDLIKILYEYESLSNDREDGLDYLLYNSIYLINIYDNTNLTKFLSNKKFYKFIKDRFYISKKKFHQIFLYFTFLEDMINCSSNKMVLFNDLIDKQLEIQIDKLHLACNYLFDTYNHLEEELESIHTKVINKKQEREILLLKINYYRKTGNIKKSMLNINLLLNLANKYFSDIVFDDVVVNLKLKLFEATNLKNLGRINDALLVISEIEKELVGVEPPYNILAELDLKNLKGLCYKQIYDISLDEADLVEAEMLITECFDSLIHLENTIGYVDFDNYYIFTNMAQIYRRKGELENAINLYNYILERIRIVEYDGIKVDKLLNCIVYNGIGNIYYDKAKTDK